MKKVILFLSVLIILIVGISIGSKDNYTAAERINSLANSFENEITDPYNTYNGNDSKIAPGMVNEVGKKIDNTIDSIFTFSFRILKKIID